MVSASSSIDAIASGLETEVPDLRSHSSPEGAVTLLFSDVEGSTELLERIGERRSFEVLRDHNVIIRRVAELHEGTVVKSQGDGFMIAFSSARAGVRCALAIQRTFAGFVVEETGEELRVRMGLHAGFVIEDAEDFFGRNVVLAARIAEQARGGEVLVSSELREYAQSDPLLRFEPRGEVRLKGLSGRHEVYAVRAATVSPPPAPSPRTPSP